MNTNMLRKNYNNLYMFSHDVLVSCWRRSYGHEILWRRTKNINIDGEETGSNELGISFFIKNIGSNYKKWSVILIKHPELKTLKEEDVLSTLQILKKFNFSMDDVVEIPTILNNSVLTLENRYQIMKECGIEKLNINLLAKYITVMNKRSADLKAWCLIPRDLNVMEKLRQSFQDIRLEVPLSNPVDENRNLKLMRQIIFNHYFQQRLDMSSDDIKKLWKVYGRVRHKSFKSVQDMVKLLLDDLKFSKERINKNPFILYADANNVRRILRKIPKIGDQEMSAILYKRPKILMSPCETLLSTLKHIKDFGIKEEAVIKCLEVLTLSPDTVLERLGDMNIIEEFEVLKTNPRILRLVHYQNKARLRLEYLNRLKVRCASLHILSCGSEAFARFARDGPDRTRGCDVIVYLANVMGKEENKIRNSLSSHPNWCHVPLLQIKHCYEFLLEKKFSVDAIFNNIQLLLYPINRINEKLQQVLSTNFLQNIEPNIAIYSVTNNQILTLLLYLIESEFHFTGDGVWTEHHSRNVENFNNLLPDFPESVNKVYKYGVKPVTSKEHML